MEGKMKKPRPILAWQGAKFPFPVVPTGTKFPRCQHTERPTITFHSPVIVLRLTTGSAKETDEADTGSQSILCSVPSALAFD
jgi:hypothetical protein